MMRPSLFAATVMLTPMLAVTVTADAASGPRSGFDSGSASRRAIEQLQAEKGYWDRRCELRLHRYWCHPYWIARGESGRIPRQIGPRF